MPTTPAATAIVHPKVPIGPATVVGWIAAAIPAVAAFVGSQSAAQWKAILAGLLVAATNWGRHYQAGKKA